jgi:hypothetical protein
MGQKKSEILLTSVISVAININNDKIIILINILDKLYKNKN